MKTSTSLLISLLAGAVIGALATYTLVPQTSSNTSTESSAKSSEKKPLYWVAPMDPNYKRDKPGKSPMGMDLIPVYEEDASGNDAGPGTIKVDPDVINNLGVTTATVNYGQLHTQINTVGYVEYDEDKLVHIHPRVSGWVEKLYVKAEGEKVIKDQPLYEIYSPELVNAQEELLIALDRKNQRLINAAKARLKALQLPQQAIDGIIKNKQVQQTVLYRAPQSGVIEQLKIREGFFVQPGTTLMAIGDLSQVWVTAEVFERQASLVKTGNLVEMQLDYLPGKQWQGKVDYVYPTLDNKTRTVKVRLRFDNPEWLFKPNMFAQVMIHTDGQPEQLLVPKTALIRTGSQDRVVLALGNGKFKSIAVEVGQLDTHYAEIVSGLNAGDKVVTSAQFLLDSESSKTSDFIRMNHESASEMATMDHSAMSATDNDTVSRADSHGTITSLMAAHGMITIHRDAIEKWGRPAAEVDFISAKGIDLSLFQVGDEVNFTFEIRDGEFVITQIEKVANTTQGE
jgi:Cu(I)/Ag(I) efflux system membrane fusion protein